MAMADGRPEGIAALMAMDSIDFYHHYKHFKARSEKLAAL